MIFWGDSVYRLPIVPTYREMDFNIYFVSETIHMLPYSPLLCVSLLENVCLSSHWQTVFYFRYLLLKTTSICSSFSYQSRTSSETGTSVTHRSALCVFSQFSDYGSLSWNLASITQRAWNEFSSSFSIISRIIYLINYLPLSSQEISLA